MSRVRHAALLILVVVLAAVAVRLGIWQLHRLSERRARNAVELAARDLPPVDLGMATPSETGLAGRRAVAIGHFDPSGELLLRNRAFRDAPGVYVATPFEVEGSGTTLWVLRGFATAPDAVRPGPIPPPASGTVTIHGVLAKIPVTGNRGQPLAAGDSTWQRLDSTVALEHRPEAFTVFLFLEGGLSGPGRLDSVEPPALGEGPHLSYAIQWFGIATAILTFGIVFVRKRDGRGPARPPAAP